MINSSRFALKLLLLLLVVLFQVNRFSAKFAIANDRVRSLTHTGPTSLMLLTASLTQTVSQDGLWLQLGCTV